MRLHKSSIHRRATALLIVSVLALFALAACSGDDGTAGAQGPAGPAGESGPAGSTGSQGLAGSAGDSGPTGPAGSQGPAGPAGAAGEAGAPINASTQHQGAVLHCVDLPCFTPGAPVEGASATLIRRDSGVTYEIDTNGLPPNNAFSIWIGIFEAAPPAPPIVLRVGGGVSTEFGTGHFSGSMNVGEIGPADVVQDAAHLVSQDGVIVSSGDGEFDTPMTAVVSLILRSHGEANPESFAEQTMTLLGGGCQNDVPSDTVCLEPQLAIFR